MSLKIKAFAMFAVLFCIAGGVLLFVGGGSQAEKVTHWITVDEKELAHIQTALANVGDAGLQSVEVQFVQNGIAALRLEDWQMEKLSSAMHDSFHKCAGFVAHESRDEAIEWIRLDAAIDTNQQFVDYTIDNQANVTPMLAEVAELSTRQVILDLSAFLTRRHNSATGLQSATWIKDKWTALAAGRSDVTVEFVTHTSTPQPSVVLTIQGTTLPSEVVVLGGHQDSIAGSGVNNVSPGADDDASGIASLTEAIRILMSKNFKPQRTVKFMAYAAEEVGLVGSAAIALDYRTRNVNVIGVMQLDMTNYKAPTTPSFDIVMVTDRTNAAQNAFVTNLISTYQSGLSVGTTVCNYGCSDHASWTTRNYPASFPHEATLQTGNPTIHTANDTINQSSGNANHAIKFSKLALSFVGELAKGAIVTAPARKGVVDFDGDAKTDLSIFRPSAAEWWINRSSNGQTVAAQFGNSSTGFDEPVPADYTGDGKTDIAFYRPSTGEWFMLRSENGTFLSFPFGAAGDIATVADFDADGKADPVIFRQASGEWYILKSTGGTSIVTFGTVSDKPVPADFDGDGKADVAIFRPSDGSWWYVRSTDNQFRVFTFGANGDRPVQGDWTGDGKADIAVWRELTGEWFIQRSEDNSYYSNVFGGLGDIAAPGDYDGDGKFDLAIFRPSESNWYVQRSTAGLMIQQFGSNGDTPLPAFRNY